MKANYPRVTIMLLFTAFLAGCSVIAFEGPEIALNERGEPAAAVKKRAAVKEPLIKERKEVAAFLEAKRGERAVRPEQGRKTREKTTEPSAVRESVISEAALPPPKLVIDPAPLEPLEPPKGILANIVYRGLKTGMYLFTWSGLIKDEEELR